MIYNKIYYAIRIDTGTTETNLNIGLDTGILTLITERYKETTSAINTIDSEVYATKKYSGFLDKKGIGKTKQSIDIINGGDYSNLNNFSFSVINSASNGETYISEIDALTEAYLIGSKIQYFVCTPIAVGNDEWFPKWTGIIDNIVPSGLGIKFSCIDRFMKDYLMMPKTAIENEAGNNDYIPIVFGDNKFSKPVTTINMRTILDEFSSQPVLRLKPNVEEDMTKIWSKDTPPVMGVESPNAGDLLYYHLQLSSSAANEISDSDNGTEQAARNYSTLYYGAQNNQYNNGNTWAVVSHKNSFNEDESFYIGKYIQFTENRLVSGNVEDEAALYKIVGVDIWGVSGTEKTAFYIEQVPSFFKDQSQFFGDTLNTGGDGEGGTNANGEIVNDETIYFSVITVENKTVISESPIFDLVSPQTSESFIFPSGNIKIYTGSEEKTPIISSLPIDNISLDIVNPFISIASAVLTGNVLDSYVYLKPTSGVWLNIRPDHADVHGYTQSLNNSINELEDSFDWICSGARSNWAPSDLPPLGTQDILADWSEFRYLKTNISLNFDKTLFSPNDYDNYKILFNMQKQQSQTMVKNGGSETRLTNLNLYYPALSDWGLPADTLQNSGNYIASQYQVEIRGKVSTFEGDRYTTNYNDDSVNIPMPNGMMLNDIISDGVAPPYEGLYLHQDYVKLLTIPLDIIGFTGTQDYKSGYMGAFPQVMGFHSYSVDYTKHDRLLIQERLFSVDETMSFKKDLFYINESDSFYNIITSITPQSPENYQAEPFSNNLIPAWDVFKLYNIGMLLTKEIDITSDIYLKVKGETFAEDENLTVTGSDGGVYDGTYVYQGAGTQKYVNTTANTEIKVQSFTNISRTWKITDIGSSLIQYYIVSKLDSLPTGTWTPNNGNVNSPISTDHIYETNNVYDALRHLINSYSSVDSVDYHNLPSYRNSWNIGRQITTRKNSFDYIRELCKQSFIAGWVDGAGTLNFDSFRDGLAADDTLVLHDSSIIIDGSIKNFKRTPISKVYNEINVQYDWNPITQKFNFNYAINKVDEPTFPLSTEDWSGYVQGINDYATAKKVWDRAHESYLETRIANLTPNDRSDLKWANDIGSFNDSENYDKTDEYAYKYFIMTTDWNTRQKNTVTYSLPITSVTKQLELMQRVRFNDPLYTGTSNFTGWITALELDALKDEITVSLTMELNKSRWTETDCNEIIERSTNIDEIIETGNSADDEILEGEC